MPVRFVHWTLNDGEVVLRGRILPSLLAQAQQIYTTTQHEYSGSQTARSIQCSAHFESKPGKKNPIILSVSGIGTGTGTGTDIMQKLFNTGCVCDQDWISESHWNIVKTHHLKQFQGLKNGCVTHSSLSLFRYSVKGST